MNDLNRYVEFNETTFACACMILIYVSKIGHFCIFKECLHWRKTIKMQLLSIYLCCVHSSRIYVTVLVSST